MSIVLPEDRVGTLIAGRYRISALIGQGGMGAIFAAVHEWTGRPVAVKFLSPHLAGNEEVALRFLQEARAAARLDHPNVVDVLDMSQTEDGSIYLVLEHLDGEDLEDLLKRERKLDAATTLDLLLPAMDALGEAHALDIVHRDIKPSNIFLAQQRGIRVAKILDFGLAQMHQDVASVRTNPGRMIGTPYYMAPEQVRAQGDVGPPADIWAMGVVLFRCLSGRLPVEAPNAAAVMMSVVSEPCPELSSMAPDVAAPIAYAVDRALQSEPSDRHGSMGDFADALRRAASATGIHTRGRVVGGVKGEPEDLARTRQLTAPSREGERSAALTTPYATPTKPEPKRSGVARLAVGLSLVVVISATLAVAVTVSSSAGSDEADESETAPSALPPVADIGEEAEIESTTDDPDVEARDAPSAALAGIDASEGNGRPGILTVRASRSCLLAIDGEDIGGTPVLARPVQPGERQLSCRPRRGRPTVTTVTVAPGQHLEHEFRFGRGGQESSAGTPDSPVDTAVMSATPDITRDYD